jgi:tetratricopeptide (TPR) repeat protein
MPYLLTSEYRIMKQFAFCIFLFQIFFSQGQTPQQLRTMGDEAFNTSNYHTAVIYYEALLEMEPDNIEVMYSLADSYRFLFSYSAAHSAYLTVWNQARNRFPGAGFYAGMMLKSMERYPEAAEMFQRYIEHGPLDDVFISQKRALYEIAACDSAMKMISEPREMILRNFNEVNTPWSEFNPAPSGDSLFYFSALRPLIESDNPMLASGDYRAQIYVASYGAGGLRNPTPLHVHINGKDRHTANIAITQDGNRAYFNRCEYNNYKLRCDIWMSEHRNNQWGRAKKLPKPLNGENFTTTQPYVTADPVSGNDLLYFSSDRTGGMGGLDLWFCIISDGEPQQPINLGSIINTPGDEITPFYHEKTGTLYFSSDWHYGMGGFDVFSTHGAMSSWDNPINAGSPVNTGANDFFFVIGADNESFLTSNRPGSMTFREQTCCNDIYLISEFKEEIPVVSEVFEIPEPSIKEDILELLPLSLYFDNDHPDPRTTSSVTKLTYEETWKAYMKQRDRFIDEYSKGLDGFEMYYAITEMEDFFDNYVESSLKKLEILADLLLQDLKTGSNVTLKVRGFTSPLTTEEYNIILSKRRISSLVNYFRSWNDGILIPYMDFISQNGATFQILEEPAGEALANPFVSDNPLDRRKSVYSKAASLERRIQIMIYESDFKKNVNIDDNIPVIYIPDNLIHLHQFVGKNNTEIDILVNNPGKIPLNITGIDSSTPQLEILSYPSSVEPESTHKIRVRINGTLESSFTGNIIIYSDSDDERNVVYLTTLIRESGQ